MSWGCDEQIDRGHEKSWQIVGSAISRFGATTSGEWFFLTSNFLLCQKFSSPAYLTLPQHSALIITPQNSEPCPGYCALQLLSEGNMAQVFAISISGSGKQVANCSSLSHSHRWMVKAMHQNQRADDEKVVYLSCPCAERLQEIKAVLEQAGFLVIYALETPPEDAIIIYVHCPLTEREREILQAILSTGSIKSAAAKLGLSINTVHKHLRHMLADFNVRSTLQLIAIALQKGFIRWEDEPSAEPRSRLGHQKVQFPVSDVGQKTNLER